MSDQLGYLLRQANGGDAMAFAKLLTAIEKAGPAVLAEKALREPAGFALRVGITGPPGAGKSTLVGQLLSRLGETELKIGVLAVDPSSPFTHGAILGDRIRYNEFSGHQNIFIRSLGTRGSLGGLSASAHLMLRAFDACGFDLVLIETVGVGQTELDVMYVADDIWVVLVPESGDSVQAMKAGLLEIADLFIVNKADRPGASALAKELEFVGEGGVKHPQVMQTVAANGEGIVPLVARIEKVRAEKAFIQKRSAPERLRHEARSLLRSLVDAQISRSLERVRTVSDVRKVLEGVQASLGRVHKSKPRGAASKKVSAKGRKRR